MSNSENETPTIDDKLTWEEKDMENDIKIDVHLVEDREDCSQKNKGTDFSVEIKNIKIEHIYSSEESEKDEEEEEKPKIKIEPPDPESMPSTSAADMIECDVEMKEFQDDDMPLNLVKVGSRNHSQNAAEPEFVPCTHVKQEMESEEMPEPISVPCDVVVKEISESEDEDASLETNDTSSTSQHVGHTYSEHSKKRTPDEVPKISPWNLPNVGFMPDGRFPFPVDSPLTSFLKQAGMQQLGNDFFGSSQGWENIVRMHQSLSARGELGAPNYFGGMLSMQDKQKPKSVEKQVTESPLNGETAGQHSYPVSIRPSSSDLPYPCEHCGKSFPSTQARAHHRVHPGDSPCVCDICGKSFLRCHYLAKHKLRHARGKVFPCETCGICFTEKEYLETHMKSHSSEQPFQCNICGKGFSKKDYLSRHLKRHTGARSYSCEVCGKSFYDNCLLRIHLRMHTDERPYSCDICGRKFRQSGTLRVHKKSHMNEMNQASPGDPPYFCDHCDKSFSKWDYYKQHVKRLSGERSHVCEYCGKFFLKRCLLTKHQKRHEERPYSCDMCRKTFREAPAYENHLRLHREAGHTAATHSRDLPFKCEKCGKRFSKKDYFTKHWKRHTTVRPHACEICGKSFYENYLLQNHKKVHAEGKSLNLNQSDDQSCTSEPSLAGHTDPCENEQSLSS